MRTDDENRRAEVLLGEAIREDPDFALAHLDAPAIRQTLSDLHEAMGMGALLASAIALAVSYNFV